MHEEEKEVNRKTWWVMGIILLVLIIGIAGYYIWFQQKQMQEMSEIFALEKEKWLDDSEEISLQFEGMKFSVNNDSLLTLLTIEQAKVQRLQEEVRTLRVTSVRQINELKRELETIRKVARSFVVQIDSLNAENEKLKNENKQVTQRYQQAASKAAQLTRDVEKLSERVQTAARLDAVNIQLSPVNNRDKPAKIDKATRLILTFIISKNITAPVGEETIYVRLMKPNDELLKKPNYGFFKFENKDIEWSLFKKIEYDGEEQAIKLYWDVEEFLSPGTYRVAIFAGGNEIGRKSILL